jgi:hypothetical protein
MALTKSQLKHFKHWMEDGNVSKNNDGTYSTQDAQYRNKLKNLNELKNYFKKEFAVDDYADDIIDLPNKLSIKEEINLDDVVEINNLSYEVIGVNRKAKIVRVKNFSSGDLKEISFDEYYKYLEQSNKYNTMAHGGGIDYFSKFDLNDKGNFAANIKGKNYEIIYRDDISEMYDLFENGVKISSDKLLRNLMSFDKYANGGSISKKGGNFNVGDKVMVDDSGYSKSFQGFELSKPATILTKNKVKTSQGIKYSYSIELADGRKPFNNAMENKLTLADTQYAKGGGVDKGTKVIYYKGDNYDQNWFNDTEKYYLGRGFSKVIAEKYEHGGSMGSNNKNGKYLDSISSDKKSKILKNIASHYRISVSDAEGEVRDEEAEMLYEYIANDQSLRMDVYNDMKRGMMAKGGAVGKEILDKEFWKDIAHLWRTQHIVFENDKWANSKEYKGVNNSSGLYFKNEDADLVVGLANSYHVKLSDVKHNNPQFTAFDYYQNEIEEKRNKNKEMAKGGGVGVGDTIYRAWFTDSDGKKGSVIIVAKTKEQAEKTAEKIDSENFSYVSNPITIKDEYILFEETRENEPIYKMANGGSMTNKNQTTMTQEQIQKLVRGANGTNEVARNFSIKKLKEAGLDKNGKSVESKKEVVKPKTSTKAKTPSKATMTDEDYDCDEIIAEALKRKKNAKKSAKKSANKPAVVKATNKVERTHDAIEKQIEQGKLKKAQIEKIIAETEDLLRMLKKALKSL